MRALISVYDKTGILPLAKFLEGEHWQIISTGGTAEHLRKNGISVTDLSEITKFSECLDGRVKTLHPAIHAGILARRNDKAHMETLHKLKLQTIDLVAVNLYPFFEKVSQDLAHDEKIEFIDIGGPTMLRAAAKNYHDVIVVSEPADYERVINGLKNGHVDDALRRHLAGKVFNLMSAYDASVAHFLLQEDFPQFFTPRLRKAAPLRYGENAHQKAALYVNVDFPGAFGGMTQLGGKEMGYNNIRDLDLSWKAVCSFDEPCCVSVKHNTPCGIALGATASSAFSKALSCDPVSIFGGIVAFNQKIDVETAVKLSELFLEIVVAPDFEPQALEILKKKKNLRIIEAKTQAKEVLETVSIDGGLLVQETNRTLYEKWDVVSEKKPDPNDIPDMIFGIKAVAWVKSNAILLVKDRAAIGIGGGETNRIWAAESALKRAARTVVASDDPSPARVLASDAFFPFPDVVEAAAEAGVKAIIQSGGSANDNASIDACNKAGIAMVFSGTRYFKH
ncbi:MAG: bifunctional phosphoribosylaminoimidazolecarboxamide formyltransferase/IMP cyclohydrolase [Termitinemataceae bacterium]|nr:MAG: bifunctional phosphoribosylaminoimidazolecarboxamide formyltransferase/IMP cyclohydrolase [Termitinemataceae bacterium]